MKKLIRIIAVVILFACLIGCDKTGYRVTIEIDEIRYSDLLEVETLLTEKGFKTQWRERKVDVPKFPNEIYSFFEKKLNDKPYFFVAVLITFVKEGISDSIGKHLSISIENWYKGKIIPEIKSEIDNLGDQIYQELVSKVGKENVRIERKEVSPPVIY